MLILGRMQLKCRGVWECRGNKWLNGGKLDMVESAILRLILKVLT